VVAIYEYQNHVEGDICFDKGDVMVLLDDRFFKYGKIVLFFCTIVISTGGMLNIQKMGLVMRQGTFWQELNLWRFASIYRERTLFPQSCF
jgi:hypothetical protein